MTNTTIGILFSLAAVAALGWMIWKLWKLPKRTCIYPHCSADRSRCLHVCPHWKADGHSDYSEED